MANTHKRFWCFISHASQDVELAKQLQELLSKAIPSLMGKVFVSSDGDSIPAYVKWEPAIIKAHQESSAVVALMTPNSVFRPWVIYEAGGANFQRRKPLFVVRANGLTADSLPEPLKQWQSLYLSTVEDLSKFCESVADVLGRRASPWNKALDNIAQGIVRSSKKQAGDWALVKASLAADTAHASPFNLLNLLDDDSPYAAQRDICVMGQGLHTLVTNPVFRDRIFRWLERKPVRRRLVLVTLDRQQTSLVGAWQTLHGHKAFVEHLDEAENIFRKWQKDARNRRPTLRLIYRPIKEFPLNITFVDPEQPSGFLVLTPISTKVETADRPHFVVGKHQQRRVFDYYWLPIMEMIREDPLWKL